MHLGWASARRASCARRRPKPGIEQIGMVAHDDLHAGREFARDIAHQFEHALHGCTVVVGLGYALLLLDI